MANTVIKVENLSKQYRLGEVGTGTISHDLNRWWHKIRGKEDPYLRIGESNDRSKKGNSEYVWALQDINFEVQQGEVLGIIGKNGAGKSTLLKILSKVTAPTTGSIKAKGRIASLLEVGTGFHPELTGRENIYLNGAILGMTKREVTSKLDEIVEFSGVARYLDTPVKRYSSGMMVRLGFAVAAHLEPEILIVDEVLAVGDAEFQKKAVGKMQEVSKEGGRTVLFVSHNMGSVQNLCTSGILVSNGGIKTFGQIDKVINEYQKGNKKNSNIYFNEKNKKGIYINRLELKHDNGIMIFNSDEISIIWDLVFDFPPLSGLFLNFNLKNSNDQYVTSSELKLDKLIYSKKEPKSIKVELKFNPNTFMGGAYYLDSALYIPGVTVYDSITSAISFEIKDETGFLDRYPLLNGLINANPNWQI